MKNQDLTTDQIAALFIVYGTPDENKTMHREVKIANGELCPECGGTETEENGATRHSDLTYLCVTCTHQWDAAECTITIPPRFPIGDD